MDRGPGRADLAQAPQRWLPRAPSPPAASGSDITHLSLSRVAPRTVPLGEVARPNIAALPGTRDPDAFVFACYAEGRGAYSLATCWRVVCVDAMLDGLRLHDLRHTAVSHAIMSGENLPLVGRLLGHRRHRTMAGYAHLADAHLVEAVEAVGTCIAQAMLFPK